MIFAIGLICAGLYAGFALFLSHCHKRDSKDYPRPLSVDLITQIESFKGDWGEWECEVHMSDGTTRHGVITGDQHSQIIASLEYTD